MAEKRKDFSNYGYVDERFEAVVSENLHCAICSNVFKDPVMCKNEHCFCRTCITEHLQNSQNCPCCNHHLSVESLTDAPRIVRNLLSELRIRCDYHERGCDEFVQLGNLANHVATCTKAPVVCVNEECSSEMNREDQARHESEECRFRKVKCRNCKEMDAMMQEIGTRLGGLGEHVTKFNTNVNEQLSEMKTGLTAVENRFGEVENRFEKVENKLEGMENKFDKLENKFDKMENQFLQMGHLRFRDVRRESMHQLQCTRSDQATQADLISEVQLAKSSNENAYIVAGGSGMNGEPLDSVEIFDKCTDSWRQSQSMKKCRAHASSVVYKGQVLVTGGVSNGGNILSSIEQFSRNPNPFASPYWSNFSVNLPRTLRGHSSVVYDDRLFLIGGYDEENKESYLIYEILLHFPFTTRVLAKIPSSTPIAGCGVVLVDDKILLFGGQTTTYRSRNVTMYDITKNEYNTLEPLPYGVYNMAAVRHGANAILCGGYGYRYDIQKYNSTVLSYNIETQKSEILPSMNFWHSECRVVVDGDSIIVMRGGCQKTVQAFDFITYKWRNLPSRNEARTGFVAEIV